MDKNKYKIGYFFKLIRFLNVTQHVFDQRMEYVQTMYFVASGYWQIEANKGHDVWLGYAQWRI